MYVNSPNGAVILCIDDESGRIAGASIVQYEQLFQHERVGVIVKFYVRKLYRGTGKGRELLESTVRWFDEKDCVFSEVVPTAGLDIDQLTINLFKKFGYTNCAIALRRYHNGLS